MNFLSMTMMMLEEGLPQNDSKNDSCTNLDPMRQHVVGDMLSTEWDNSKKIIQCQTRP